MTFYSLTLSFFILMDIVGNVPVCLSLLKGFEPKKQRLIIIREMLIALAILFMFYFLGDAILGALNITHQTLMISGGIILFLIALKMIFPPEEDASAKHREKKEPFIVPIAIPLIAGPGILAAIMLFAEHENLSSQLVLGALFSAWAASLIILLCAPLLQKLLGDRTLHAIERLMGLILTMMAIQMFLDGLKGLFL
jgi:multiple antibiotic resistance protein